MLGAGGPSFFSSKRQAEFSNHSPWYCNLFPKHLQIQYLILMVSVVLWVRVEGGIDIPILHIRKLSLRV